MRARRGVNQPRARTAQEPAATRPTVIQDRMVKGVPSNGLFGPRGYSPRVYFIKLKTDNVPRGGDRKSLQRTNADPISEKHTGKECGLAAAARK